MRRLFVVLSVLWLWFQLPAFAASTSEIQNRVYVIGGDENFPPYEYFVESEGRQVYRGFNVDIMKAIALETGIEIEFRPMTWAKALKAFDEGELDAIQGMKYDQSRAERYDFSIDYLTSAQAVFVRNDTFVTGLEDLKGQLIAVQEGDIAYQRLKDDPAYHLIAVSDQSEAFRLLLEDKVIAVIGNKLAGRYILQRSGNVQKVKIVGSDIDPQKYGVAVRKGNVFLLETINRGILGIKKNGTYKKIYTKWFGEQLDYPSGYYKERLLVALYVLAALGLAVILLSYSSYILRREVAKRTEQIAKINQTLLDRNEYIRKENLFKENILNSCYSGIVTVSHSGIISFANDYARQYFADSLLVGKHFSQTPLALMFPTDSFETLFLQQQQPLCGEKEANGRQIEYTLCVLRHNEKIEGALLTFRDVTVEKQLREKLSRKDKMESLGNLVAGIAHEIRTPLTSIKTFAELLPEKIDNPAFRQKLSQYVPQEVERINAIVNDLLDYARPRQPFFSAINLKKLLLGICGFFSGHLEKNNVQLQLAIDDNMHIYADKQQVQQVIINILLNAIEAMEGCENPSIVIASKYEDQDVLITFADNGKGVDSAVLSRIFDPFFTTKPNGTGLGLAICYQCVKENHGEIWLESSANNGAIVYLRLPRAEGDNYV